MYIILLLLLLAFIIVPEEIEQRKITKETSEAIIASYNSSQYVRDSMMSCGIGLKDMCVFGASAHGPHMSLRELNYPIGSQEDAFLDATVIYRFYVRGKEDCWLIIEAEQINDEWLLFGCHMSSGTFCPSHGWKWECVSIDALEEIRKSIYNAYHLCLVCDTSITPGEKTLKDYVVSK